MQKNKAGLRILYRKRLNEKLDACLDYPLSVVVAPMGYGKTIAIRNYLDVNHHDYVWITATKAVNVKSEDYLWYLMTKEIRNKNSDMAFNWENRGYPNDSIEVSRFVEDLLYMDINNPVFVIIDDYHLIENDKINILIDRLINVNIPWLHIILIGRKKPNLPISEMLIKNICLFINKDDLSFNEAECAEYFRMMDFSADDATKNQIYSYSNGWIAAIYLMIRSYSKNKQVYLESLFDMIKSSLFDEYDSAIKETLIKLSIFDAISLKQAVFILDNPSAAKHLHFLEENNAFISVDNQGYYKFHQIFLNFLNRERMSWDIDFKPLFQKAGQWFSDNGNDILAFNYWMAAGEYDCILRNMEKAPIVRIDAINQQMIFSIFNVISEEKKYQYPLATLKYIFLVILYISKNKGGEMLNAMEEYYTTHKHTQYSRDRIFAEIEIMRTTFYFNDISKVVKAAKKAHELLGDEVTLIRNRGSVMTYGCPHFTYAYYTKPGEYQKIVNTIKEGFGHHIKVCDGCGMGAVSLSIAEHALETGAFNIVEQNANKAFYSANEYSQICIMAGSLLTMARLYMLQKRQNDLEKILEKINDLMEAKHNIINRNVLDNCLGYIYANMGCFDLIPAWLRTGDMMSCKSAYHGMAFNYIIYQKAMLLQAKYSQLEAMRESMIQKFDNFHNQLGYVHCHIVNAIVKYKLFGIENGAEELQTAFDIAVKDNLITPFVEYSDLILPVLNYKKFKVPEEYLNKIKDLSMIYRAGINQKCTILTPRENEVMKLLMQGESSKTISEKLYISQNTVKRHMQNIYQKLGVNNKVKALKIYMEMNQDK